MQFMLAGVKVPLAGCSPYVLAKQSLSHSITMAHLNLMSFSTVIISKEIYAIKCYQTSTDIIITMDEKP